MAHTLRARRTLAALLIAGAAAVTPFVLTDDQHSTHTEADSIWGIVAPANPTPAPTPAPSGDAPVTPQDSIWG
ncbi:hypothetical protein ABZ829_27630 [Streptomyces xanthochromogenes]|uniref:hypothetical protein n=1 Tax=Streptomyces xanthochromogenes TaxID=67384 RepID=UPI00343E6EA7